MHRPLEKLNLLNINIKKIFNKRKNLTNAPKVIPSFQVEVKFKTDLSGIFAFIHARRRCFGVSFLSFPLVITVGDIDGSDGVKCLCERE